MNTIRPILIVEDSPEDAAAIIEGVADHIRAGRIVTASDGEEALRLVFGTEEDGEKLAPAVILLDLSIPHVKGLDVLGRLKDDPITTKTPVVVFTGAADDRSIFEAYDLGVNAYVVKPQSRRDFVATVHRIATFWLTHNSLPAN